MSYLALKHLHIATSAINVFFANTRPRGTLTPLRINLEADEADLRLGAATITDLTWKQELDLYACTECGRCQAACPAWNTGKPLSPKLLVMDLRDHLLEQGPKILDARRAGAEIDPIPLVPEIVDEEVVWSCTTCGACMQECPVDIEHVDTIVDLRRYLALSEGALPGTAGNSLQNMQRAGNPWGLSPADRLAWTEGLDVPRLAEGEEVEYLYWVGCSASYDRRNQAIARAVVKVLRAAGVSFAVMAEEKCNGDAARRLGEEYT